MFIIIFSLSFHSLYLIGIFLSKTKRTLLYKQASQHDTITITSQANTVQTESLLYFLHSSFPILFTLNFGALLLLNLFSYVLLMFIISATSAANNIGGKQNSKHKVNFKSQSKFVFFLYATHLFVALELVTKNKHYICILT